MRGAIKSKIALVKRAKRFSQYVRVCKFPHISFPGSGIAYEWLMQEGTATFANIGRRVPTGSFSVQRRVELEA